VTNITLARTHASANPDELIAQAGQQGLSPEETQLLNQIQADTASLKADEQAEKTQKLHVNPQRHYIRESLLRLSESARQLWHTTEHYQGHRGEALKAMAKAHDELKACYQIDSHM
jgi:hypothetical protein